MQGIPTFPYFKDLELTDQAKVEKLTRKFKPYSDFNFLSLWIWNTKNKTQVSKLNGNLVILFNDYITNKPTLSFLGLTKVIETIETLLKFSHKNKHGDSLRLIAKETVETLPKCDFLIKADRDSFDYIYSITNLASMNNWPKSSSRKRIRQFIKIYPNYSVKLAGVQQINKNEHLKMFQRWAENKDISNCLKLNEYKAFKRFLELKNEKIKVVSLYVNRILIGFTVYEIQNKDYALSHFAKADNKFHSGTGAVLNWEEAKLLNKKNFKYYNWEQDLGLSGLRKSKEEYKPSFFLKKFTVKKKS